ncbi:DUF2793 domain-containing protein [Sphingomonas sp. R-74633]|uniref:DUF2793 domain-containing protein n=1 Tax=Sphingomonas sp. R-74633 TaxID=2751188 RepID=UPI0015D2FE07|nr:DUF2793 domain-containing protein [Sphingomonas sp. R-74633]NYT42455.1 DUF2793 domain-containing protein [Sphingomonas sp. R-74633]
MTDTTDRLALPLLVAGQAQKEMHHNEAITVLDLMTQAAAEAIGTDAPPAAPLAGQCWIVGDAPTDAWLGHARAIAGWTEGGWRFVAPREGMRLWLGEAIGFALFIDGSWRAGETHGRVFVSGEQIVGPRETGIAEPVGGIVVDAEARAAVSAVLVALRAHGLIEPD